MLINREFPKRPEKNKLDELKSIDSATISAELKHLEGMGRIHKNEVIRRW